jgi:peptidoglycan/xylan/chitin deacetylase (PgdA/CDA1 family)
MGLAIEDRETLKLPSWRPPRRRRRIRTIVSIISILLLLLVLLAGSFAWLAGPLGITQSSAYRYLEGQLSWFPGWSKQVQITPAPNEIPVSAGRRVQAEALAQQYMKAFLKHQYKTMWSLLHPQVQALWPGETAFAKFWRFRFQGYTLQGFVVGKPRGLLRWVNPETMVVYHQVIVISDSLQLQSNPVLNQQLDVPPEDLNPSHIFQNLPFVVQQVVNPGTSHPQQSHWLVLDGGPIDLEAPILPPLHPLNTTLTVPILMYHHISNFVPPNNLLELSLTVSPEHYAQQMDYLKEQGYHTITFNQFFAALYYGGPLPSRPIILTFDDGYDDVYHYAFPILQAHGFSGMFYIITGVVGWKGYLNWDEIRSMLAGGMQIGSHTIHHVNIGSTYLSSPAQAQQELQVSKETLQRNLGVLIQQFCYPSGEPFRSGSLALQQRIVTLLAEDGYIGATTDPGRTGIDQNSLTPFDLLRIRVDGRSTLDTFIQEMPWNSKPIVSLAP